MYKVRNSVKCYGEIQLAMFEKYSKSNLVVGLMNNCKEKLYVKMVHKYCLMGKLQLANIYIVYCRSGPRMVNVTIG